MICFRDLTSRTRELRKARSARGATSTGVPTAICGLEQFVSVLFIFADIDPRRHAVRGAVVAMESLLDSCGTCMEARRGLEVERASDTTVPLNRVQRPDGFIRRFFAMVLLHLLAAALALGMNRFRR